MILTLGLALVARSAHADAPAPAPAPAPGPAPAPAQPLDSLRERFREGTEKYEAGAFADAIVIWESIYRELGADKGYRVAFDIARAYGELGELIKAAEHYETFLERVDARRAAGLPLDPQVEKHEADSRARLEKIAAIKGRIHVKGIEQGTVIVHVDNTPARVAPFTVYVEPGDHRLTFGAGAVAQVETVTVSRGELLDVDPPSTPATPPPPPPPPEAPKYEMRVIQPFSPAVVGIGAGIAALSLVLPVITYANALAIKSDYDAATRASDKAGAEREASLYDTAKRRAYVSLGVSAFFTAAAGSLALWYVLGTKETRMPLTPQPSIGPTGASLDLSGRF